jgi:hypothetical protein
MSRPSEESCRCGRGSTLTEQLARPPKPAGANAVIELLAWTAPDLMIAALEREIAPPPADALPLIERVQRLAADACRRPAFPCDFVEISRLARPS